jgi:hypothetical protein
MFGVCVLSEVRGSNDSQVSLLGGKQDEFQQGY